MNRLYIKQLSAECLTLKLGSVLTAKPRLSKLASCMLLTVVCACSSVPPNLTTPSAPVPETIALENETQKQVQSASHWRVVAEDMANQLVTTIEEKKWQNRPVYIHSQTKATTFTRAFNDFLITTLVNKGVKVSNSKQGSRIYNYKIQLVEYNSLRGTLGSEKLKFTGLAAGFVVVRNIGHLLGFDGGVLATGAALDAADLDIAPNLEIIITSSILDGNLFVSRSTDIYYANRLDKHLYKPTSQNRSADDFNEPFYQFK